MIAALGTLAFLSTLWLLVVVGAAVLEEGGAKIAAALKGEPARRQVLGIKPIRMRVRYRQSRVIRAAPRLRAAA